MSTTVFDHDQLGPLKGVALPEGGAQFRNILYATIPQRWQHSVIVDDLRAHTSADVPYDATQWGPLAPQPEGTIDFDFGLIQKSLPVEHEITIDEEKCLNLVVTTPDLKAGVNLPVIVFIHGGGFFLGGNCWPQYDLRQFVKLSAAGRRPVIGVGINYRLGLLGALASSDLTGPQNVGNFAFGDQANALRWVQKNIYGFGGDPDNVTIMGESAGAISVWMQFLKGEPTFARGIVMSGDTHLRPPQTLERGEEIYKDLILELKIQSLSTPGRVEFLKSQSWQKLVALPQNTRCYPTISGGFHGLSWDTELGQKQIIDSLAWCKTLVIGDCELDATAMLPTFPHPGGVAELKNLLRQSLSVQDADVIHYLYRLDKEDLVEGTTGVHPGIIEFATDVRFYAPVVVEGQLSTGANLHIYHFHEPNPFEGPFKGRAGHVLDVAYTLQTYQHVLPEEAKAVSKSMGNYVIGVAYGDLDGASGKPGEAVSLVGSNKAKSVMVWDADHKTRVITAEEYDRLYRRGAGAVLQRVGITKCSHILDIFQGWVI